MISPVLTAPACPTDPSSWCPQINSWTGNEWLATYSDILVIKPIKILLTVLIAYVVRYVAHRLITRVTEAEHKSQKLLQPLQQRRMDASTAAALNERRKQRARTLGSVLKSVVSFLIIGAAVIKLASELGYDVYPVLASASVLGVAVAFGAQNLVRDFLSGMFMMVEDQYGVGDVVDVGEAAGTVESVGLRVTTLRDVNGTVWYVRNGEVVRVGNSSQGFAVAVVDFPVSHTSSIEKAQQVALEVATEATKREPLSRDVIEPPDMLGVDSITSDTVTLRLTAKVRPGKQWAVQRKLRADIKRAYDDEDIHTPYPNGRPVSFANEKHEKQV